MKSTSMSSHCPHCQKLLNTMPTPSNKEWFTTREAATTLGVSAKLLYRFRLAKELKSGIHYRERNPKNCERVTLQWHIRNIETYLAKPTYRR